MQSPPTAGNLLAITGSSSSIDNFEGLAIDEGSGTFYGTIFNDKNLYRLTSDGTLSVFVTLTTNPTGLVVGPDGYLYVLDYSTNKILKMSLADGSTTPFATLTTGLQIIYH